MWGRRCSPKVTQMNNFEVVQLQDMYAAMSAKGRALLVEELALRQADIRWFTPEYAEANDDGSLRMVWVDGMYRVQDLEFDAPFYRLFRCGQAAEEAAQASFLDNLRKYSPDALWRGDTDSCYGFSLYTCENFTLESAAARLRDIFDIEDDDERYYALEEMLGTFSVVGLSDYVGYSPLAVESLDEKEVMGLIKLIDREFPAN